MSGAGHDFGPEQRECGASGEAPDVVDAEAGGRRTRRPSPWRPGVEDGRQRSWRRGVDLERYVRGSEKRSLPASACRTGGSADGDARKCAGGSKGARPSPWSEA
jgi:hypothetical protein